MDETHLYNLTFIGAGNVATHLSQALSQHHCCIRQVFSRTEESARELAGRLHTAFTTRLDEIDARSDLYIVSIKDSALNEVLPALTRRNPDALFVHTAGSVPMSIWNGLARRHGVIYPMQTFSKQRDIDFTTTPFFIEANSEEDTRLLMQLAQRLSKRYMKLLPSSANISTFQPYSPVILPTTCMQCVITYSANTGFRLNPCFHSSRKQPGKYTI